MLRILKGGINVSSFSNVVAFPPFYCLMKQKEVQITCLKVRTLTVAEKELIIVSAAWSNILSCSLQALAIRHGICYTETT